MTNLKIFEYFNETGEEIIRDLTPDEIEQKNIDAEVQATLKAEFEAEKEAIATAKAELLTRLGITADEAALLLK